MHSAWKVGLVLPAVALMVSGCVATRSWVTEHVNKKEVEIDQKIGGSIPRWPPSPSGSTASTPA